MWSNPCLLFLFYLAGIMSEIIISALQLLDLPEDMFHGMHGDIIARSQSDCTYKCLDRDNYDTCTAIWYHESTCECGRVMCNNSTQGSYYPTISVFVNSQCELGRRHGIFFMSNTPTSCPRKITIDGEIKKYIFHIVRKCD